MVRPMLALGLAAWMWVPTATAAELPGLVRLSRLVGAPVLDRTGEGAGIAADAVIDMHERRVAYVLVAAGPGAPVYTCVLAPGGLAIHGTSFVLPRAAEKLEGVPSCSTAGWPREPAAESPRHVLASEMLRAELVGEDGARVGSLQDVVVEADDGELAHAVGELRRGEGPVNLAIRPLARNRGRLAMATLPDVTRPQPLS